ncbi:SEC7 domain-containing protein [Pseudozyma hubeiensis]|nr:SEC7 domain-containing protein [Pseudozyma hubeiensis]
MVDAAPNLTRQGSVARTNAIAMLKRAASHREIKSRAATPALPGAFPLEPETDLASSSQAPAEPSQQPAALESSRVALPTSMADTSHDPNTAQQTPSASTHPSPSLNNASDQFPSRSSYDRNPYGADNAVASTSLLPIPGALLSSDESHDRSRSPMFQDKPSQRPFNRSPLPSLEQLRARILLERESAGLQRSASTRAASQAARAYALEKLLGNSGTDVFYDHTPEGTLIGRGAATPSPTPMSSRDDGVPDMASDDESAHETRLKRQSIKHRPSLRRSRTVNGLTALAEAQKKAEFVHGVLFAVPGPASNRISRIHQRRIERQSMLKLPTASPAQAPVPEEDSPVPALPLNHTADEAAPNLSRQQSQRQMARTEMLRKLSTRGRGTATPTPQPIADQSGPADYPSTSQNLYRHPRLPQVITNSPAVDESISPVGVVIRPPSSPVPPHLLQASLPPAPAPRQALSPVSAAAVDAHTYAALAPEVNSSAGLKASSSAASLASDYAHSTVTNASARHIQERNRESAMAILNNEDSFGLETSPSMHFSSIDAEAIHSSARSVLLASPRSDNGADEGGLNISFDSDAQRRRRAGLVGLGLASVLPQAPETPESNTDRETPKANREGPSSGLQKDALSSNRASRLLPSLNRLHIPRPTTQELLSSPASYTDEESLEDDAFYQLYSPAAGGYDDGDDSDQDDDQGGAVPRNGSTAESDQTLQIAPSPKAAAAAVQGLGLATVAGTPKHSQQAHGADFPTTPPSQRLFQRGMASVPCDPSPGVESEFGEARRTPRTPWMNASPGGVNLPLRLSNSLMSTDSPAVGFSPATARGDSVSRKTRGDWPMSIASNGTDPPSRESLEDRTDREARLRSSEEARALNGVSAIGSPLIEVPEDEAIRDTGPSSRRLSHEAEAPHMRDSDFDFLSVPSNRAKPSERLKAMLGSDFVKEYAPDMDLDARSRSSMGGDDDHNLRVPDSRANGSSLSPKGSNLSISEVSDVDGDIDDAYLRKVDRMADKLGVLARTNHVKSADVVPGTTTTPSRIAPTAPRLERSNTANGSRFTEHVSIPPPPASSGHSQRPSADLSLLIGNEKLHPFPGLSQAGSPVQMQEGFSPMAVSAGPPSSAATANASDIPLYASAPKGEQDANGKQIGLFTSLRRKASSLRRTPSSAAKEGSSFWARRGGKKSESPKLPTEASFISAPILTGATPGPAPTSSQPIVTVEGPHGEAARALTQQREKQHDATFEHRLFGGQSTDKSAAPTATSVELQRNASISSVVSARIRPDLQDGTADADGSTSSDHHAAAVKSLAPTTAAMIHRYSRMLSSAGPMQTVPGATQEDMLDPPRKLLATDPVFQVISATTIKDRFLFLFSDILVIAKPVSAPGAENGQALGKMKQASVLPSLSWKFSVKNILELHRLKVSVTSNTRSASAKTRAQNPVLWGFVSHFTKDPDAAVRALVAKTGLETTAASIAQLLYQTPELDRHDLTQYLGHPSRREILKAYVSQHRHVGVSIESALRALLLDLRFPTDLDAFEALLMHFAQSWTSHNASMIKPTFTEQIASDLVFAMMALNDALHTGVQAGPSSITSPNFPRPVTVVTPSLFSAPCPELSKQDFVSVFRQHDPTQVLSDRTLSRIYLSIRSEPLVQALDRFEPRFTVRVKGGRLPTRLTYAQPAEPVTLVIPAPDPDLAIRLYAQDTTFEPPILTFANSNQASFTMWTKSLGSKQVVFVRAGRNARFYGGAEIDDSENSEDCPLPRSFNVSVERAFMKHSFTLTSGEGGSAEVKRFMFSFENAETVERWSRVIRENSERCLKEKAARTVGEVGVGRATEMASLQVLRETLIASEEDRERATGGGLNRAATFTGGSAGTRFEPTQAARAGQTGLGVSAGPSTSALDRTTSTSRSYYSSSGVGRHERELLIPSSSPSTLDTKTHTKNASSLSLYPPSTSRTRFGTAPPTPVARSNSARTASSPQSSTTPLPTLNGLTQTAPSDALARAQSISSSNASAPVQDKVLPGNQIVSIARLNSLLVRVVAHHQQQR